MLSWIIGVCGRFHDIDADDDSKSSTDNGKLFIFQGHAQTENISISLDKTARVRMQIWGCVCVLITSDRHQEYRRS